MADQTLEVNTAVEDHVEKPDPGEQEVSGPATDDEPTGTQCRDPPENTHPAAAESGWSAPILSLARKATETISSGMSYAAAPRKASQDSAVASAGEKEAENDLNSTAEKLPGKLKLFQTLFNQTRDYFLPSCKHLKDCYFLFSFRQLSQHMTLYALNVA